MRPEDLRGRFKPDVVDVPPSRWKSVLVLLNAVMQIVALLTFAIALFYFASQYTAYTNELKQQNLLLQQTLDELSTPKHQQQEKELP